MSLKTFHLFFISLSTVCCVGFGVWLILSDMGAIRIAASAASFLCAAALVLYGLRFRRKFRFIQS
ncbi:MAG TPA: hypothetical protein VMM57_10530 [Bacteroidota bacterium]|nr:hypothetical protein [Bacteroidota bacterium]